MWLRSSERLDLQQRLFVARFQAGTSSPMTSPAMPQIRPEHVPIAVDAMQFKKLFEQFQQMLAIDVAVVGFIEILRETVQVGTTCRNKRIWFSSSRIENRQIPRSVIR